MSALANLATGTWEDAQALIGETIGTTEGADAVSAGDIRRQLEVLGWDCPLHYDEEVAREHGYETAVSPVSMTRAWAIPCYWQPGQPRIGPELMTTPLPAASVPGRGDTLIATAIRMEYGAPIYPGDRISSTAVLKSVTPKTTRVGRGAFLVVETSFTNQRGEVVATETATLLRYAQHEGEAG
jgi:acyl dehydratase